MTELLSDIDAPSDAELISRVRGGDVAAYGELFARHKDAAHRLGRQLVRGSDSDDLVAEAFAKVLQQLQGGGGPDVAFRAYLLTAVRRLHVDRVRAGSRLQTSDDMSQFDPGIPFQDTAVASFESGAAAKAFASLPERWQLVLWHLEVEGQKPADIAPLLGMSANSVSALAYRAREGLRQAFLTMHLADISAEECRWVTEHLGGYVRKGLSRRDVTKVEGHLEGCRRCTAMYLELSEVNSNLAGIIAPLLLGAAAAGYAASSGGAGITGVLVALSGRVRDVFVANTAAATAATVAAGVATVATAGFVIANVVKDDAAIVAQPPVPSATVGTPNAAVPPRLPLGSASTSTSSSPSASPATSDPAANPSGASPSASTLPSGTPATIPALAPSTAPADAPLVVGPAIGGDPGVGTNPGQGPGPVTQPTQPAPTQPAPTTPAPTDPAPTSPAPTSPAPTSPAPTTSAPTSPAPTTPAPTSPAPTTSAPPPPVEPPTAGPPVLVQTDLAITVTPSTAEVHIHVTAAPVMPETFTVKLASSPAGITFGTTDNCAVDPLDPTTARCTPVAPVIAAPFGRSATSSAGVPTGFDTTLPLAIPNDQKATHVTVSVSVPEGYSDTSDVNEHADDDNDSASFDYAPPAASILMLEPLSVVNARPFHTVTALVTNIEQGTSALVFELTGVSDRTVDVGSAGCTAVVHADVTSVTCTEVPDSTFALEFTLQHPPGQPRDTLAVVAWRQVEPDKPTNEQTIDIGV